MDGRRLARRLKAELAPEIAAFSTRHASRPNLVVVLAGDEADSVVYAQSIVRWFEGMALGCSLLRLLEDAPEEQVVSVVRDASGDPGVHGVLVQMPLPPHVTAERVIAALDPGKDVEGLHPDNVGRLASGYPRFAPTTPLAGMELLREYGVELQGKHAVILGRSNVVGKPLAQLMLARHAAVTILHSRSGDAGELTRSADVLAAAAGSPELVRGDMVKPGAVVLDFGINVIGDRMAGDVAFDEAARVASLITPVPGGVGPLTNVMLARNVLTAAQLQADGSRATTSG